MVTDRSHTRWRLIQTDPLARASLTMAYTIVMLFITAGIGKLFYDN